MSEELKITERELYTSIIDGNFDMNALVEFANKKLAQLDKRNESAKKRAAKKRAENDELTQVVLGVLTSEPLSRGDVLEAVLATGEYTEEAMTLGRVGYQLSKLVREGFAVKQEAVIEGEDGKNKHIAVYSRA